MSKSSKTIILVVVLLIAIGAAMYVIVFDKKETPNTTNTPSSQKTDTSTTAEEQKTETTTPKTDQEVVETLTYSDTGFSPSEITVEANQTIKVVNQSSSILDFSSDPHPTHTDNPELNVGDIAPGESATFTISKAGDWGFHNHYAPNHHGTVMVK